ncbi:MAG: MinD/ParA family protein [Armatimonadota bacterium]
MDQAARLREIVSGGSRLTPLTEERRDASKRHPVDTRVIAVTSGKGGVGKTTIAVNIALLLAEQGKRVLIVDADLGLANVDVMLGLESGRHLGHLLHGGFGPEDVAAVGPFGVRVISGGSGLKELAEAKSLERKGLLEKLRAYYGEFEYVIIDTSPGIRDDVTDFLGDADDLLLVTTPEPTSLRDSYALIKTLDRRTPALDIQLVINMAASDEDAKRAVTVVNDVALKFLDRSCDIWHCVQNDPVIPRTIHARKPVVVAYPRSASSIYLRRLAAYLQLSGS